MREGESLGVFEERGEGNQSHLHLHHPSPLRSYWLMIYKYSRINELSSLLFSF